MSDVTQILESLQNGNPQAAEDLLPLVYEELRSLATAKMAEENPGQTLSATSLVHEAYVRLVDVERAQKWDSRGHFFAAAAEAMRRILVESARRKQSARHGGEGRRFELAADDLVALPVDEELLDLDLALTKLEQSDPALAELVQLRTFGGMSFEELAAHLGVSVRTAKRHWAYARAWLGRELASNAGPEE